MVIEKLKKKEGFTDAESDLAEYILNYGENLGYVSIQKLAELTYTSTTTIQRFCRKIGCEGFKDFKIKYMKEIGRDSEASKIDVNRPFHFGAQSSIIARNLSRLYEQAIHTTLMEIDYEAVNKAVGLIGKAEIILLYGVGDSGYTAKAFGNRLMKLGKFCIHVSENYDETGYTVFADQRCLGLFVSYRGVDGLREEHAAILKKNHVPVVLLCGNAETRTARLADVVLKVPYLEKQSDNIGTFFSQECFSFCLNLIYGLVYARNYQENAEKKRKIDHLSSRETIPVGQKI